MHFRLVKDSIAVPLHRFGYHLAGLPESVSRTVLAGIGAAAKAAYFLPGSSVRRKVGAFCQAAGRTDPWPIYSRMVDNLEAAALHFFRLYRHGSERLVAQTVVDSTLAEQYQRLGASRTGLILLTPHCAGSVLSSAGLGVFCPTGLLVRESREPVRARLMIEYLEKLGPRLIVSRNTAPATVMRHIARALREGMAVVGTADVIAPGVDTVEVTAFGQHVSSPAWPARISARFGVPIVPIFQRMDGERITLLADEGYVVQEDLQQGTQRWMASFERLFRRHPSDWVFMLDKHWSRVFAIRPVAGRLCSRKHEPRP
ncbi:MAG TPA: hypothetical protein VFT23_12045 [Burkholderiales bacterium]|nr:hypothetical protein [Burkholderiales bacterium]